MGISQAEIVSAYYVTGPYTLPELIASLNLAHGVAAADVSRDILGVFHAVAVRHGVHMDDQQREQVARAVLRFIYGIGARSARHPIESLHTWHSHERALRPQSLAWALNETLIHLKR
jgi:hypothetical protein